MQKKDQAQNYQEDEQNTKEDTEKEENLEKEEIDCKGRKTAKKRRGRKEDNKSRSCE